MGPRPARSAATKGATKIKAQGKSRASKDSDLDMDEDNYEPEPEGDDDDSDEYVEPTTIKDEEDDDDDEHMLVDEDLDGDEDVKPKKQRRRKQLNNFSIPLDEMNRLLSTPNHTDSTPTAGEVERGGGGGEGGRVTTGMTELNLHPVQGKDVVLKNPSTKERSGAPGKRVRLPPSKKPVHKKGELHCLESLPSIWKFSYQGPTSEDVHHVSMQQEYLQATVYPNITSNIKDFRVLTEPSDLDEYLPVLATTRIHAREREIDMRIMTAQYMESTKQAGINDYYVLNAGFSVWALDWCPLPSNDGMPEDNMDYVAIGGFPDTAENCISRDQLYPLGKQDAHPNMIQIWTMNCNTNDQGELQGDPQTYLSLCILHSYGAVFDLKWCPTGGFMQDSSSSGYLTRLGILAATFSDGTIRIFSVPEPDSLRAHLGIETPEGSTPEPIYIEYPEPYATIRLGDICFMSINWGTSERLAAGATNGTIAVWDMKLMLSQSKETLAEKDSEYLDPVYLPQVHDVSVRCVDWLRSLDPTAVPWILASSGYDGRIRYTDLHDIYGQIDVKTILGVPMASIFNPWAEAIIYIDFDFGAKMDQLYQESRGFRLFNAKGTIWDFAYSDYQPFVAAAISDGRVKISNPSYKAKRGYGMVQNNLYQVQEVQPDADEASQADPTLSSSQSQEEERTERKSSFRYKEGEEKEYMSKTAGFLKFYGADVAVQKVQWSKCFHSAAWLASGSAGGLVRIDNTMLRKEEGGHDNKIAYMPEAYLMKKRMAAGTHVGPDGQYAPPRIGRPPKEGGPRRLLKGKKKKATPAASKSTAAKAKAARKGAKSKTTDDDHDSDEEEPEAVESGHDDDDDDDDNGHTSARGLRDEDEFVGRVKDTGVLTGEKRATRLSTGRLAPIFARQSSRNTAASEDDEADQGGEEENDREGAEEEETLSSAKRSARKSGRAAATTTAPAAPTKNPPTSPVKPRGRPRKNPLPADPVSSTQTLLSMMGITRPEPSAAAKDTLSTDVEMADVTEVTGATEPAIPVTLVAPAIPVATTLSKSAPKTSAANKTEPKKSRGRPPKARPAVAAELATTEVVMVAEMNTTTTTTTNTTTKTRTTIAVDSNGSLESLVAKATAAVEDVVNGAAGTAAAAAAILTDRRLSSESAASSCASSMVPEASAPAPATPTKKAAAVRTTKKRKEEEEKTKATNRTLKDLWGKNAKDAQAKP
ncbi:hypothetical protein BGX33_011360 [Mortierella sp. NVP41]|nr:hypothetical protein BGX33_011360 [Mortierella sp. NVP41]